MLKIVVNSPKIYSWGSTLPIFKKMLVFNILFLDKIVSPKLFSNVIDQIRMPNGTCKTTIINRFSDLDQALSKILVNNPSSSNFVIHDVAISDGITSVDLYNELKKKGLGIDYHSSDNYAELYYGDYLGLNYFIDKDGQIVRISYMGILCDKYLSWKFGISKLLGIFFLKFLKRKILVNKKTVLLLSPNYKQLLKKELVHFKVHDVFDKSDLIGFFDVIRCMNILNTLYFTPDEIKVALTNLSLSLKENGLIVIGRTNPKNGLNEATIYEKHGDVFSSLESFNGGCEIDFWIKKSIS